MLAGVRNPEGIYSAGPITVGNGFASLFSPSARRLCHSSQGESTRERQVTFSVGYKERVEVVITGGGVWKWRHIVFTYKGTGLWGQDVTWNEPFHDASTDPDGCNMVRLISQPPSDQHNEIRRILWDGHEGLDWASEFSAKADTSRISLLYDRTFTFNPRNESGFAQTIRLWHPTRKLLYYDEDESAGKSHAGGSYMSVDGKPGMGDLYVYDIVALVVPAAAGNASLTWIPQGTYYWHER